MGAAHKQDFFFLQEKICQVIMFPSISLLSKEKEVQEYLSGIMLNLNTPSGVK